MTATLRIKLARDDRHGWNEPQEYAMDLGDIIMLTDPTGDLVEITLIGVNDEELEPVEAGRFLPMARQSQPWHAHRSGGR